MLESFLSVGTDANWVKDVISRHPEEVMCETIIKSLLKDIEEENLGVACLLGIAHVLERFDSVSAQRTQWLFVLDKLFKVAQHIKRLDPRWQFDRGSEFSWTKIKRVATVWMVICSIACSTAIDPSKLALFELATIGNDWLRTIEAELDSGIGYMTEHAMTEDPEDCYSEYGSRLKNMCDTFEFFFETSGY